jgi:hypothetical protein
LLPNVPWKTAVGHVFWETIESRNGWKLQRNIFTNHYRIIDPENFRQAWGYDEKEIRNTFRKFTNRIES